MVRAMKCTKCKKEMMNWGDLVLTIAYWDKLNIDKVACPHCKKAYTSEDLKDLLRVKP